MIKHLVFSNQPGPFRLAILIRESALREREIRQHYITPLVQMGVREDEIVAFNLMFNAEGKVPVRLAKEHLGELLPAIESLGIQHILVTDGTYFKVMCKVRKAEPHYGYVLPTIQAQLRAALCVNYTRLFHDPTLNDRLMLGLRAIGQALTTGEDVFQDTIFGDVLYINTVDEMRRELTNLLKFPALTCDIETRGLHLRQSLLLSIAFAWNKHGGRAFYLRGPMVGTHMLGYAQKVKLLRNFFEQYQGKLIFHSAPFDTGRLITELYLIQHSEDTEVYVGRFERCRLKDGLNQAILRGLEIFYRDLEDTKLLSYLATNTTAGNHLSLKEQALEYAGNYAIEEIQDPDKLLEQDLLQYNMTDALATWYVYEKHRETVRQTQESVYQTVLRLALKVITQMELTGLPVIPQNARGTQSKLRAKAQELQKKIQESPIIQEFNAYLRLQAAIRANKTLKVKRKTAEDFPNLTFNPNSHLQLATLFHEFLDLPVLKRTATGSPTTDSKTLDKLIVLVEKRL